MSHYSPQRQKVNVTCDREAPLGDECTKANHLHDVSFLVPLCLCGWL